jgi:hypothetical protein
MNKIPQLRETIRAAQRYGKSLILHLFSMHRPLLLLLILLCLGSLAFRFWPRPLPKAIATALPARRAAASTVAADGARLKVKTVAIACFARLKGYSTRVAFLVDMRMHCGRKRFFIYDLQADTVLASGLVAHGSCNMGWLTEASFGNEPGCGCTSTGRYKVGYPYQGRFGTAFKLYGLDSSNNNAFRRFVVLHAYDCIPDVEIYPRNICNSLGCPMVSYRFLETAARYIRNEKRPVLMWVYN